MRNKNQCGDCRYFDQKEGYCIELEIYRKKDDGKNCEFWKNDWGIRQRVEEEKGEMR